VWWRAIVKEGRMEGGGKRARKTKEGVEKEGRRLPFPAQLHVLADISGFQFRRSIRKKIVYS
jgi:hypothetical protein